MDGKHFTPLYTRPAPLRDCAGALDVIGQFLEMRKDIVSDVKAAHELRRDGASEWMREEDCDMQRDLNAVFEAAEAVMRAHSAAQEG